MHELQYRSHRTKERTMTTRMLVLVPIALLAIATVGLFAESKAEFSLNIHPVHETSVPTDAAITLEVMTTNLTDRRLDFMEYGKPYTYIVRRDGVPAPKIARADMIMTD